VFGIFCSVGRKSVVEYCMQKNKAIYYTVGFIVLICFVIFKPFLTFKNTYFFWDIHGDGYYYSYPVLCNICESIRQFGIPTWSFKMGMGQNILPFLLRDPFDVLIYIGGKQSILPLVAYIEVFKIILSGLFFYKYLEIINMNAYTRIAGAIFYAFCGFMMVGGAWFVFSFEVFNFSLLLLGFELLFLHRKGGVFLVAIALLAVSMPFNLYVYGLFIAIYAVFRLFQTQRCTYKQLVLLLGNMMLWGGLALMIVAPMLVQNVLLLLNSPRGSGTTTLSNQMASMPMFQLNDGMQFGSCIFRWFSNDIFGDGNHFKGWDTILGAPLFYCGLPCLLFFPQLFWVAPKKERIVFIVFCFLWLLPIVFPYFRHAFWLFTGDYYRSFSFLVCFVLLYCSLSAFNIIWKENRLNVALLVFTYLLYIAILFFPPFIKADAINSEVRLFVVVALTVYTAILLLIKRNNNKQYLKYLFLFLVAAEAAYAGSVTVNTRGVFSTGFLKSKVLYNNYTLDAVRYIQKNDPGFYRIDKNYEPESDKATGLNYSQGQGYNGTTSYNSFNQLNYIKYLQTIGLSDPSSEQQSRWSLGLYNSPVFETENSVKYFISQKGFRPEWHELWDSIAVFDDVTVYRSKFAKPLGYTYSAYIPESDFKLLSPEQKKIISLSAVAVRPSNALKNIEAFKIQDTFLGNLSYEEFKLRLSKMQSDTLCLEHFADNSISGTINASKEEILYLSIPSDQGWHVSVDGKEQEKLVLNGGMMGCLLNQGTHHVVLNYRLPYWEISWGIVLFGVMMIIFVRLKRKTI
jgi:uncharacterized membrane protein YfhO